MAKRPIRKQNIATRKAQRPVGVKKRIAPKATPQVQDARQKLTQRKRNSVVDARDVLAKMAKTQDARDKINKLRQKHPKANNPNGNVKVIGNIVQKTDRHGKITLSTKKNKPNANMNVAIRKELGMANAPKKQIVKRTPPAPRVQRVQRAPQVLRQNLLNDMDQAAFNHLLLQSYDSSLYKWPKPAPRTTASQLISSLENRMRVAKGEPFQGWQNFAVNKPLRVPQAYIDLDSVVDDEVMPMPSMKHTISLQGSSRISNIHSRLDRSPAQPESHGILAQTKTKVVVPAGHRIVVSNLQQSVTQDDVKELFEDIGHLLAARLVRPGVAEVIYKNLKDAQKAVDTYHNRQLDGQPMKCLLVNKRPMSNPTAPPMGHLDRQGLINRVELAPAVSNKLVPDLSTIHKVLFQRK